MGQRTCSLLCLTVLVCIPAIGLAQTIAPSLPELSGRVKPGDTVYVTESSQPVKGKVIAVSASSLVLSVDGRRQDFDAATLRLVERERRATKKGALIGLLVGAGALGAIAGVIEQTHCGGGIHCEDDKGMAFTLLAGGGFGGGVGAAAGAAIGAARKRRETVFVGSGRLASPTLSLASFIDPARKGVALLVRF